MRNMKITGLIALSGLSATAAYATQPPDNVLSDAFGNTAVGKDGLLNLTTPAAPCAKPWLGCYNTAAGSYALLTNTTGHMNTAMGSYALAKNTSGYYNTAGGSFSLLDNTTGYSNTAFGSGTLFHNTTGAKNTASGSYALWENTTGERNTASGYYSLYKLTTGNDNTALGSSALQTSTTGFSNAAVGSSALFSNTTGANNTAFGYLALYSNTIGKGNAAQGVNALYSNTTGIRNLGIGNNALYYNVTGSYNIALGFDAGYNVTTGSNNIEIGSSGAANDNATIQIGMQGTQTQTMIAGIYGTPVTGSAVYVSATGQLGVLGSSGRFKTDIAPMPALSEKLGQLRPVTFHYKTDPHRIQQYGLIAEEVDKVYPELVIRDGKGQIQGVRYEELAPMLLNEVQRQQSEIQAQHLLTAAQTAEIHDLKRLVRDMRAGLEKLQARDQRVAER